MEAPCSSRWTDTRLVGQCVRMYVLSMFILDTHNTHTHNTHNAQYAVTHDRKVTTPTHSSPTQLKVNEVVDLLIAKGMK
jgi:uncharacterized protein YqjF (DUF2071 family)